ncbi:MAG: hypothetical protein JWN44_2848 [Myxococcales bacterium]|nr:hypothetical protein [Myxococcales bacterium]
MQQMLQKLAGAGVAKLKAPFAFDFDSGFDPILKAFPGAAMKDPLLEWMTANAQTPAATLAAAKNVAGIDKSFVVEVIAKLDEAGQLAAAQDAVLRNWLRTTYFATEYPTEVFAKVKSWVAPFKADAELATWLASDDAKLNACIAATTNKAEWVGALMAKQDVLRRLMVGAGWKPILIEFSTACPGDHAALKADAALLKDVLVVLGDADASVFLKNLACTIIEGAKALKDVSAAAIKTFINDATFDAAAQAAACRDADFQAILTQHFQGEFISDVLQKLIVGSAELPLLYKDVQPIFDWMSAGPNKAKLETAIKVPTPNLADWIAPLIARVQHSFILLSTAANAAPWVAAVTGQKFTDLMTAPPQAGAITEDEVRGTKALTNNAATLADLQLVTRKLYTIDVQSAGGNPSYRAPNSTQNGDEFEIRYQYKAIAPTVDTYKTMLAQFAQLPRSHVNTQRVVVFGDGSYDWFYKKINPLPAGVEQLGGQENLGSAFFDSGTNVVVLRVDAAGVGTSNAPGDMVASASGQQTPRIAGASPTVANPVALTYFQNNATHEAGHAVGARTLNAPNRPPLSGDQMALTWSNWQDGRSESEFLGAMWTSSQSAAATAGQSRISASDAKKYLMARLRGNAGAVPSAFPNEPAFLAELRIQHGQQRLFKYVEDTLTAGNKYTFPNVQPGSNVYLMNGQGSFSSYDKFVFDNKQNMSWYALSAYKEMFAEMYTRHFAQRGALPGANRGIDPSSFFTDLEQATDADLSAAPAPQPTANKVGIRDQLKRWLRPWT